MDFLTKERRVNQGQLPQYLVENAHDPIVPREIFMIAQGEMLRQKTEGITSQENAYTYNAIPLSGIARCGLCNAPFKRYARKEYETRWRCRGRAWEKVCKAESITESALQNAIIEAINRLPEKRTELIRIDERIKSGEVVILLREMEELAKRKQKIEQEIAALSSESQEDVLHANSLHEEMDEIDIRYDEMIAKRGELGIRKAQAASALDLADSLEGRVGDGLASGRVAPDTSSGRKVLSGQVAPGEASEHYCTQCTEGNPAACYDVDDFFRRTTPALPVGPITKFDDDLLRRYIRNVIIYEDSIKVQFKAGVEIDVRRYNRGVFPRMAG